MKYKFSETEIDTVPNVWRCLIANHAHNEWGSIGSIWDGLIGIYSSNKSDIVTYEHGGITVYEWTWGSVFDHYNYHYELGALYQQINKLPINSLYNASSGVTFSIYA